MLTAIVLAALSALALIFAVNRLTPISFDRILSRPAAAPEDARETISAVTWNIGYASLGAGADFLIDGGSHLRALKRPAIAEAAGQIADRIAAMDADVVLIQEAAASSFLTRGIDVRREIFDRLSGLTTHFWADFRTYLFPAPLRIEHGMASITRLKGRDPTVLPMPQDPKYHFGFLKKHYAGLVTTFPIAGSRQNWVVINMHLSAFDPGAATRNRQIKALFDLAQSAYAAGDFVVIGGDWNMRLSDRDFPHQTDEKYLFWIHDMPDTSLPEGWQWAVDPDTPTVRSMNQPYVAGENFTMVIDGFAVSPNVQIDDVTTTDLQFQHTDHHPVRAQFRARVQT